MTRVRAATSTDFEQVHRLYTQFGSPIPIPVGELGQQAWDKLIDHAGTTVYCVERSLQVIGLATLHILPNMTYGARSYALIENVITAADEQRKGIGSMLLNAVIAAAWDADCYKVMLLTNQSNGAREFYRKVGFSSEQKHAMTMRRAPNRR